MKGDTPDRGVFPKTRWTLIAKLRAPQEAGAAEALDEICRAYWYPLYVYARRFGLDEMDAKDVVQELFFQLLAGNRLAMADAARGRLRAFLLTALKNVIANWREKMQRGRRGGGAVLCSLDMTDAEGRYLHDAESGEVPPDRAFERKWAVELLRIANERLRETYEKQGKLAIFTQLAPALADADRWSGHAQAATALGMNEGAVKVSLHRLRRRFREALLDEVGKTVENDAEVRDEVAYLMGLFVR